MLTGATLPRMTRTLSLRKETLSPLTPSDLSAVGGAGGTIDGYPTWICTPLIVAVTQTVKNAATQLSVVECP